MYLTVKRPLGDTEIHKISTPGDYVHEKTVG
jgi:hypothetical protein